MQQMVQQNPMLQQDPQYQQQIITMTMQLEARKAKLIAELTEEFKNEENLDWHDPWLKSLDLEYHNLNKESGLFWGLEASGDGYRKTTDPAVDHAKRNPPRGTRAQGRGELIKKLIAQHSHIGYLIDWIGFRLSDTDDPFLMLDPLLLQSSSQLPMIETLQEQ